MPRLLLVASLVVLAATGCQRSEAAPADQDVPAQTLTIVTEDWNGWDPDHRSTPETTTLPVEVGASASVSSTGGPVTFEVVEVGEGEIRVESDGRLAPTGKDGGSNLNDLVDEFTVVTGTATELDSPTLDAGHSYTLTLAPTVSR